MIKILHRYVYELKLDKIITIGQKNIQHVNRFPGTAPLWAFPFILRILTNLHSNKTWEKCG